MLSWQGWPINPLPSFTSIDKTRLNQYTDESMWKSRQLVYKLAQCVQDVWAKTKGHHAECPRSRAAAE